MSPDDRRLWARVTRTVAAADPVRRGRLAPPDPAPLAAPPSAEGKTRAARPAPRTPAASPVVAPAPTPARAAAQPVHRGPAEVLEPRRKRRLVRERDPIEAKLDLHGHGRFQAEDALIAFLMQAQARGYRAVLVVTGQGRRGGGVIRASIHDWLTGPALQPVVSGFAPAHRRHGGDGALYVTLRRL